MCSAFGRLWLDAGTAAKKRQAGGISGSSSSISFAEVVEPSGLYDRDALYHAFREAALGNGGVRVADYQSMKPFMAAG